MVKIKNHLEYKGYYASIEMSIEDQCFIGSVEFINDHIVFDGEKIDELQKNFEEAINLYLETCQEIGKDPDKPFKGTFNIRVGSDRHRTIAINAFKENKSINEYICNALDDYIKHQGNHVTHNFYVQSKASAPTKFETSLSLGERKYGEGNSWVPKKEIAH